MEERDNTARREWHEWFESLNHGDKPNNVHELVEQMAYCFIRDGANTHMFGPPTEETDELLTYTERVFAAYEHQMRELVLKEWREYSMPAWWWVKSLGYHDKVESPLELVHQMTYDILTHSDNLGPNGNTWEGIDEGEVLTDRLFDDYADKMREVVHKEDEQCR